MPSRHISPQSFDDIFSELGDDPTPKAKPPKPPFSTKSLELRRLKFAPFLIFLGILPLSVGSLFLYLEANKGGFEFELNAPQTKHLPSSKNVKYLKENGN
jgi:hypothetical protein